MHSALLLLSLRLFQDTYGVVGYLRVRYSLPYLTVAPPFCLRLHLNIRCKVDLDTVFDTSNIFMFFITLVQWFGWLVGLISSDGHL